MAAKMAPLEEFSCMTSTVSSSPVRVEPGKGFGGCQGSVKAPTRQKRTNEAETGRARSHKKRKCLIPKEAVEQERAEPECREMHINDLPSDLLVQIFSSLDAKQHKFILPLVCKYWQSMLASPLGLWNHLDIDFAAETEEIVPGSYTKNAKKELRESRVLQWVRPRAAAVKSLRLRGGEDGRGREEKHRHRGPITRVHDFTGNGVANLLTTVASPLEELVIEYCHEMLNSDAFKAMSKLGNLKVLCLKGICTTLTEGDFCAIADLNHLQELVLDCEQPPDLENGAEEIKWGLQDFPEGMLHLTNMTHLTLTCHYGISELPENLSKLNKLEVLNLDFCTLSALPASLGELTALTTLDVEGNLYLGDSYEQEIQPKKGASFPPQLAGLSALRYFNLNSCGLVTVPPVVGSMTSLETLDLENNNLGGLEMVVPEDGGTIEVARDGMGEELHTLKRMQCLNLTKNKLRKIPDVVAQFLALRILDLTDNELTNAGIPDSLTQLSQLKAIGLKRNNLSLVPKVLGDMRSLQEIYLENNPFLEVEESLDFMADLPNLRIMMMGKQVGSWSPSSFHFISHLTRSLAVRHPGRDILLISFPGHQTRALPDDAYVSLM